MSAQPRPEPPLPAAPPEPWWIASYSALLATGPGLGESGGAVDLTAGDDAGAAGVIPVTLLDSGARSAAEDIYAESQADAPLALATAPVASAAPDAGGHTVAGGLHPFPRGAGAGSFLHGLLEWAGRQGFARVRDEPDEVADLIARRCNLGGFSRWTQPLRDWLGHWLRTPWPLQQHLPGASSVCPTELGAIQVEMEFWFPAAQVNTRALDALVSHHTLDGAPRVPLQPNQLNGMLKGFIDLVFEHEGRYFVADYKSNWLGPDDAHYTPQAMRDAVLHHRYELQYTLYLFALHRLLRSRLPDYDYDRHVGGAVYLFLRGYAAPGGGLHVERPPRALIEALDALFDGVAFA